MNIRGKIIVIDGLDGCGKSTQLEMCRKVLSEKNTDVCSVSFPDYESPSSSLVKMYLSGEIAKSADDVNAYAASSFYAVDRYASYMTKWGENYRRGEIILSGRYTSSNIIHQMCKLPASQHDDFVDWLMDYEHVKLGIPKADMTIFLDIPVEVSQQLLEKRYEGDENKKDIHEADTEYIKKCRRNALFAADKLGWEVVDCMDINGKLRTAEEINDILINIILKGI